MIQANELRIGNLISFKESIDDIICIIATTNNVRLNKKRGIPVSINYLRPIPLTEEWLVKFGFKNKSKTLFEKNFYEKRIFSIVQHGFTKKFCFPAQNGVTEIKYVHQLQNLYFALTGKELEIKNVPNEQTISEKFKISNSHIYEIKNKRRWNHV